MPLGRPLCLLEHLYLHYETGLDPPKIRVIAVPVLVGADLHFHKCVETPPPMGDASYIRLPEAPDMEIYCMYGVDIPTERAYIYKLLPNIRCKSTPYHIDSSTKVNVGLIFTKGDLKEVSEEVAKCKIASQEFTALTCIPGVIMYRGAKIQGIFMSMLLFSVLSLKIKMPFREISSS